MIPAKKAAVSKRTTTTWPAPPPDTMAKTTASRVQAATSSTAAQARVMAPTGIRYRPRSARIRASTGKRGDRHRSADEQGEGQQVHVADLVEMRRIRAPGDGCRATRRQWPRQAEGHGDRTQGHRRSQTGPAPEKLGVHLQADQEHEDHQADLSDIAEIGPDVDREDVVGQMPGERAEQAWVREVSRQ